MEERNDILQVKHLCKNFGGLAAVKDVSLHVNKGEIVGLIGANGAGKTTLFNMVAGAIKPTSGEIIFSGKRISGLPAYQVSRQGVARTHQIVRPFSLLTVLDNVMVGAMQHYPNVKDAKKKAIEVCEFLELGSRMNVVGSNLNLPELKRMEMARALATEPELLLLDEAMAGLNPAESARIIELVRYIRDKQQITIIVIEHVMRAIMALSDRIYVLNQGHLIAEGSPAEISIDPEVIRSYLGDKHYAKA